jgi:hypothetical protein
MNEPLFLCQLRVKVFQVRDKIKKNRENTRDVRDFEEEIVVV